MIAKNTKHTARSDDPTIELAKEIAALARGDYARAGSLMGVEHFAFNWFADLSDGYPKARKDRLWDEVKRQVHSFPKARA